jgi:hypothetical protein
LTRSDVLIGVDEHSMIVRKGIDELDDRLMAAFALHRDV